MSLRLKRFYSLRKINKLYFQLPYELKIAEICAKINKFNSPDLKEDEKKILLFWFFGCQKDLDDELIRDLVPTSLKFGLRIHYKLLRESWSNCIQGKGTELDNLCFISLYESTGNEHYLKLAKIN